MVDGKYSFQDSGEDQSQRVTDVRCPPLEYHGSDHPHSRGGVPGVPSRSPWIWGGLVQNSGKYPLLNNFLCRFSFDIPRPGTL